MKKKSFAKTTALVISVFFLLLFLLLAASIFNTGRALIRTSSDAMAQSVEVNLHALSWRFDANRNALLSLITEKEDLDNLKSESELRRQISSQNLLQAMEQLMYGSDAIQELIIYDSTYDTYLARNGGNGTSAVLLDEIENWIREKSGEEQSGEHWYYADFDGHHEILLLYQFRGRTAAAVIPLAGWIREVSGQNGDIRYALTSASGELLLSVDGQDFPDVSGTAADGTSHWISGGRVLTLGSSLTSFCLYAAEGRRSVYSSFGISQAISFGILALAIALLVFLAVFARKQILVPTGRLIDTMKKIENGQEDLRVDENAPNAEFQTISQTFNRMMDTIVNLRIHAYEDRIQFDEATLKYVQLQIRPHFFLNALTTIHSMSFQNRNEDIREYIERLSRNVRYLFKAGLHTVPLKEEVDHVRDYISMQDMLYPGAVFDFIDVEDAVAEYPVPQLIIHTMVENIYKHAVSVDSLTCILISAKQEEKDGEEMCHISVEDDGKGYPLEFLEQVNHGEVKVREDGHGVGLWNLKKTLSLMYRRDDLIVFSNKDPHGSRVDIWIPKRAKRQSSVWKL